MKKSERIMALHCSECTEAPTAAREAAREVLAPRRAKLKPRSKRPAKVEREYKRFERNETTTLVHEAVWERSEGFCESCGGPFLEGAPPGSMDHFFGGSKRRSENTVPGCWRLCRRCDHFKTENKPSRLHWLNTYLLHCQRHHYAEQVRKVRSAIALEEAQRRPPPSLRSAKETEGH